METRTRPSQSKSQTHTSSLDLSSLVGSLACAIVFFVPFFPDEKLTRLKLEALELGLFSLGLVVGLKLIWSNKIKYFSYLNLSVLFWVLVNVVFWFHSSEKSLANAELRRVLLGAAAFYGFSFAGLQDPWKRRLCRSWSLCGGLLGCYGLLQVTGGVGMVAVPQMSRIMGTYGNPIFFAAFLISSIFVSIEAIQNELSMRVRLMLIIGLLIQILALYFTRTRAAWVAFALAFVLGLMLQGRLRKISNWIWVLIFLGIGIFIYKTTDVWHRHQGHTLIWRDTLRMWKGHPLIGVGPGAFHTNFPSYAQEDLKSKWPTGQFIVNYTHNEYLQTLAETGLIGLIAFLMIPVLFFINRKTHDWLFFGAAALFIQNFFSADMRFSISFANCFMLMGLVERNPISDPNTPNNPKTPLKMGLSAGWVILLLVFVLPPILKPYRAQKEVSATPGFFDQRLLDPAKSIAELENLKTQYPNEPALLEKLAYVYAKEIRTSEGLINNSMAQQSIETYRHLIRVNPSRVGAYNNLANIYYTTGKIEEALSTWKEALSIKPDFIDAHLNLGKILYSRGQLKEAAQHFEHVLKIDPSNSEAIVYLKRMVE